jgi:hypothetical protein
MFNIFSGESTVFLAFPTLQPGASIGNHGTANDPVNLLEGTPVCANLGWPRYGSSGLVLPTGIADGSGSKPTLEEYLGPIG